MSGVGRGMVVLDGGSRAPRGRRGFEVSNSPGNPGNLRNVLECCKVSWKLSAIVRLFVVNVTNSSMKLNKPDQYDLRG